MRLWRIPNLVRLTILLLSISALIAHGQESGIAVRNGTVTDPQGAVVNGAQVSASNLAIGAERNTLSSSGRSGISVGSTV